MTHVAMKKLELTILKPLAEELWCVLVDAIKDRDARKRAHGNMLTKIWFMEQLLLEERGCNG